MDPRAVVTTDLELRLVVPGGPALPVLAGMRYQADDPWAVRVSFHTGADSGDGVVVWMFARQLLTDGLRDSAGRGDVRVWPAASAGQHVVNLAMASPSGSARFEIDREQLVVFLQQTYLAVPTGAEAEAVDLDRELALLLGD